MPDDPRLSAWLGTLEERHLSELTPAEVARALRALSSCYVERRAKLASGGALDGAGKRAAFALFYAPLHYLVVRDIVRALPTPRLERILDLGCGTGAAGAAWALASGADRVEGVDRNPWAAGEARQTYRAFGLAGRAIVKDLGRAAIRGARQTGILAAYTINELPEDVRGQLLPRIVDAARAGACVLVVEPIARSVSAWWSGWEAAFGKAGGRADEWRFPIDLPPRQAALARAAGLDPRELTARSLWMPGGGRADRPL